jgi:hypothetical protein
VVSDPAPGSGNAPPDAAKSFFETIQGAVLTSIPALSALVFVVVAVKVFRAAMMETTTTVAIVSTADVVALLKGVILTLLPGFLAGLTAASIWWWAGVLPTELDGGPEVPAAARRGLLSPQALWAWAMTVMAFFTVWWPVFLVLLVPVLAATVALVPLSLRAEGPTVTAGSRRRNVAAYALVPAAAAGALLVVKLLSALSWPAFAVVLVPLVVVAEAALFGVRPPVGTTIPLSRALKVFGLVGAAIFIGLLTLAPTVWLPLRTITFTGKPHVLKGRALPHRLAAYVLSRDDQGASLLLSNPRAVIQVGPHEIEAAMPLCVPPESRLRVLTVRASQVLGLDSDPHSPYEVCPEIPQRLLGGG